MLLFHIGFKIRSNQLWICVEMDRDFSMEGTCDPNVAAEVGLAKNAKKLYGVRDTSKISSQ